MKFMAAVLDELRRLKEENPNLTFLPGASDSQLAELEREVGAPLPADYRALASACAGIEGAEIEINFLTHFDSLGQEELHPNPLAFAADGCGNFWVADLRKERDEASSVFFWCHDPPVFLFQCSGMQAFLQALNLFCRTEAGPLADVAGDVHFSVWDNDPEGISQAEAMTSSDASLRHFAGQLDERFRIVDLRQPMPGMGIAWGRYQEGDTLRRFGSELIFAYRKPDKKPGLFSRLFGRS